MERFKTGEIKMEPIEIVGYCDLLEEEKQAYWEELKYAEEEEEFWRNFDENFAKDFDLEETEKYEDWTTEEDE